MGNYLRSPAKLDEFARFALMRAYAKALESPDPSTQNAAAIFAGDRCLSSDVNRWPDGLKLTPEIQERPLKYTYIEHAERNAIYSLVRTRQLPLAADADLTMVAPWAACADCARAIVQSGIKTLIRHRRDDETGRWGDSIAHGDRILEDGRVKIIEITGPLGGCDPILFGGELWTP